MTDLNGSEGRVKRYRGVWWAIYSIGGFILIAALLYIIFAISSWDSLWN